MKNFSLSILAVLVLTAACNVFNSSSREESFEYRYRTDQMTYASKDTVRATFENQYSQALYVNYQTCTLTNLQKHENNQWKSIPIPIFCTQFAQSPLKVEPGGKLDTWVNLGSFDQNDLAPGTYRLDVVVTDENGNQKRELVSNKFEITD